MRCSVVLRGSIDPLPDQTRRIRPTSRPVSTSPASRGRNSVVHGKASPSIDGFKEGNERKRRGEIQAGDTPSVPSARYGFFPVSTFPFRSGTPYVLFLFDFPPPRLSLSSHIGSWRSGASAGNSAVWGSGSQAVVWGASSLTAIGLPSLSRCVPEKPCAFWVRTNSTGFAGIAIFFSAILPRLPGPLKGAAAQARSVSLRRTPRRAAPGG